MSTYIIAYHGGEKPETPEEGEKHMGKWQDWIKSLGDAVINPGTPLGPSKIVSSKGVSDSSGSDRLTGYVMLKAETMDAAIDMAKKDPFLTIGNVEVAEVFDM
jgi:hypothetical protein